MLLKIFVQVPQDSPFIDTRRSNSGCTFFSSIIFLSSQCTTRVSPCRSRLPALSLCLSFLHGGTGARTSREIIFRPKPPITGRGSLLSRQRLLESQFSGLSPLSGGEKSARYYSNEIGRSRLRFQERGKGGRDRGEKNLLSIHGRARARSCDTRRARRRRHRQDVSRRYKIYVSRGVSGRLEINQRGCPRREVGSCAK